MILFFVFTTASGELKHFFILTLRGILIFTIIHFNISSATGNETTNSQHWDETPVTENKKNLSKETLNTVYDAIETLLSKNEINEDVKYEMKSFWLNLEEKILSENWTVSQVIDFFINKILEKRKDPYGKNAATYISRELLKEHTLSNPLKILQIINSFRKIISLKVLNSYVRVNAIYVLGELTVKYSIPYPEILQTLNLLQKEWHTEQMNSYKQVAVIQSTGNILENYDLPYPEEISQSLNQMKQRLFHRNEYVRLYAQQTIVKLFKANKVPDTEQQEIIFWVADHLNDEPILETETEAEVETETDTEAKTEVETKTDIDPKIESKTVIRNKLFALEALTLFLKQDIPSDPDDRKEIAPIIAKQLSHTEWESQQTVVIIALQIYLQKQDDVLSPNDTKEIARALSYWLAYPNFKTRREAIKLSEILLNQIALPLPDKSKIAYITAGLIFDKKSAIRQAAFRMIKNLLMDSGFPLTKKQKIVSIVSEKFLFQSSKGGNRAIDVLQTAKQVGVRLNFRVIHNVTHKISAPLPFGQEVEDFVNESLKDTPLDSGQRLLIHLEMDEQLLKRDAPLSTEDPDEETSCRESYSSPQ